MIPMLLGLITGRGLGSLYPLYPRKLVMSCSLQGSVIPPEYQSGGFPRPWLIPGRFVPCEVCSFYVFLLADASNPHCGSSAMGTGGHCDRWKRMPALGPSRVKSQAFNLRV